MTATPAPTARPAAQAAAVVVGLLLLALAGALVRDAAVALGWLSGSSWTLALLRDLDGLTSTAAVQAASAIAVVLGVLLVLVALRPARATHRAAGDGLWLSPAAMTALAATVADRTPGVVGVDTRRSGRRRIALDVVSGARHDPGAVEQAVTTAVRSRLEGLPAPALRVRVKGAEVA